VWFEWDQREWIAVLFRLFWITSCLRELIQSLVLLFSLHGLLKNESSSTCLTFKKMGIHLEPYDCATLVCSSDANVLSSCKSNQRPDISSSFASSSPCFTNSYVNIREDCEAVVEILVWTKIYFVGWSQAFLRIRVYKNFRNKRIEQPVPQCAKLHFEVKCIEVWKKWCSVWFFITIPYLYCFYHRWGRSLWYLLSSFCSAGIRM